MLTYFSFYHHSISTLFPPPLIFWLLQMHHSVLKPTDVYIFSLCRDCAPYFQYTLAQNAPDFTFPAIDVRVAMSVFPVSYLETVKK